MNGIFPVIPLASANARFQPVWVEDVAQALVRSLDERWTIGQTIECTGPAIYTLKQLVQLAGHWSGHERWVVGLPDALVSQLEVGQPPKFINTARLKSLDVFRGLTIAGMILVNDPGTWSAIYWPLAHADELMTDHPTGWYAGKWWVDFNGWTPTDLIFPFFLFIVGVSMVLSFAARQARGDSPRELLKHAMRRSVLIL